MDSYHLSGSISSLFFLLCLAGLRSQLKLIFAREELHREDSLGGESPSSVLSLNQFASSYLSFYAFFMYGFSLERFNHYLVWPRIVACLMVIVILYRIALDRRDRASILTLIASVSLLLGGLGLMLFGVEYARAVSTYFQFGILILSVILGQGYLHQAYEIVKSGKTGGVSLTFHQLTLTKDLTTILFSFAMGLKDGWPLLVMCSVSAFTKIVVIFVFLRARNQS